MSDLFSITDDVATIDRSTLERWADCPRAAAFTAAAGEAVSKAMASGTAAHEAISEAVQSFLRCGGDMAPAEFAHDLTTSLRNVRPDLQPDALEAIPDHVRWSLGRMFAELHAGDVLRFDGGDGDQSGQLARDVTIGESTVRVTSELDLLLATRSPDILAEHDWKTGWTPWTADDVENSFQFQLHWWLVAEVYPDCQSLDVTIWETRHGRRTDRVRFQRRDLPDIQARVMTAVGDWHQFNGTSPASCVARPFAEKCGRCSFSVDCFDAESASLGASPESLVDRLVILDAACDTLRKDLWSIRDSRQADIVSPSGNAFGWDKPKGKPRKPENPLYSAAASGGAGVCIQPVDTQQVEANPEPPSPVGSVEPGGEAE